MNAEACLAAGRREDFRAASPRNDKRTSLQAAKMKEDAHGDGDTSQFAQELWIL